ncbi:beta-1,3-galactosyltransferase 2-like [Watersipora subatra]|uniref:beta-1,3-galactosyltransferase 2-like n=1 Tax=Watersipora subatra TaxID=2589382 RepID=UPI00355C1E4A
MRSVYTQSKGDAIGFIASAMAVTLFFTINHLHLFLITDKSFSAHQKTLRNFTDALYATHSQEGNISHKLTSLYKTRNKTMPPLLQAVNKPFPINQKLSTTSMRDNNSTEENVTDETRHQKLSHHSITQQRSVNPCSKSTPQLLIWIYSAPTNFDKRQTIRQTWGDVRLYLPITVRVVFSLAAVNNPQVQKRIKKEIEEYDDIIQTLTFIDSYRNLSLKASKMLVGTLWLNPGPKRYISFRWTVTSEEWPKSFFAPKACPGFGYFISGDAIKKLQQSIHKNEFLECPGSNEEIAVCAIIRFNFFRHAALQARNSIRHNVVETCSVTD